MYSVVFNDIFTNSNYSSILYADGNKSYVNTGILFFNENSNLTGDNLYDNRSNEAKTLLPYTTISKSFSNKTGKLYTVEGSVISNIELTNSEELELNQYPVAPTYSFSYPNDNSDERHYCVYDSNSKVINIGYEQEKTTGYTFNPNILTVTKMNNTLPVTIKMDGETISGNITFNTPGNHVITYSFTDPYNYDHEFNNFDEIYSLELTVCVLSVAPTAKNAYFIFYGYNSISKTPAETFSNTKVVTVPSGKKYIMPDVNSVGSYLSSTTVDGVTVYCPKVYVDFNDNSSDFNWLYPVFLGVDINDYADGGTAANATAIVTHNTTSKKPSGITIITEDKPGDGLGWSSSSGSSGSEGKLGSGTYNGLYGWTSGAIGSNKGEDIQYGTFSYKDYKGDTFYFVIAFVRNAHTCPSSCVAPGTLITLADGTQKPVEQITSEDRLLTWDFVNGRYVSSDVFCVTNHGVDSYAVTRLVFSDGSEVKLISEHGLFDADTNKFVNITSENANEYIGHKFVKFDAENGTRKVELISAETTLETTSAYSIIAVEHLDVIANEFWTLDPSIYFLLPFGIDSEYRFNSDEMSNDIETYGLMEYDEFKQYAPFMTEEQFIAGSGKYIKIALGKGIITMEEIMNFALRILIDQQFIVH